MLHSIAYLAILTIQVIEKRDGDRSPEEKFKSYVQYMCEKADMLGAVETEVAKHCFTDRQPIKKAIASTYFSGLIRKNFMKGGGSLDKRLGKALNSARDISYYRVVASQSNEPLDGKIQDTWLVTADEGLKHLAQSIYFIPGFGNSDSKAIRLVRSAEQKASKYWNFCDRLFTETVIQRNGYQGELARAEWSEFDFQQIFDCIRYQEAQVRSLYPDAVASD